MRSVCVLLAGLIALPGPPAFAQEPVHKLNLVIVEGSHSLSVVTNAQGRAVAHGIHLNNVQGQFQIQVTASYNGLTATTTISQSVAAGAAGAAAAGAGISTKLIVILAVAAAAAAGGALYATHSGGSGNAPVPGTSITAGTGTVGPPK